MNKLSPEKVCEVYTLLAGGVTINQTAKATGVCKEAVLLYGNGLGEISESWYGGNVEWHEAADPKWRESTPSVTICGFTFQPIDEAALADARRFAVAKAKQAKRLEALRYLVALRVVFYAWCEGNPTPSMRLGVETKRWSPDELCLSLFELADDENLMAWPPPASSPEAAQ